MNIKIYSTPTCPHCVEAKEYFKKNDIDYQDIDVGKDAKKAEEMIKISGQMGVPVIKVDNKVLVGFDQGEIEDIIKK
jgi:glutaredoxin-like YruB-family protein